MRWPRHFFRHASAEMLEAFLAKAGAPDLAHAPFVTLKAKVDWASAVIGSATPTARDVFYTTMVDVGALAGDLGAQCLRDTVAARRPDLLDHFIALTSDYDRGIWIWCHDDRLFEEAINRWFFERRRPTGTWTDAYVIPTGAKLVGDKFDLREALMPIVDQYDAGLPGVVIEQYELADFRTGDGAAATLLSITYEGRWSSKARIENGEVSAVAERVIHHVAVLIESAAGLM
jgi:hypothetical protein